MFRIFNLVFFAVMLLTHQIHAQVRTVRGTVTDAADNAPLPGVNVLVEGTTKGTATDIEGKFTLDLSSGENVLVFSFVGYQTKNVRVDQRTTIDVVMEPDRAILEDVVVIGYGTVRKSDLTGAVSSVRGNDLTKIPSISPMQALQGKVPGLQVTSTSGAPGAGTVVRVRGTGTFNNANPIFVVDGVILDNIDFLNPADIESMEVLKDASATAIYGSRGANGVIMVTTRKGTQEVPVITVGAEYSIQRLQNKIDLLSGPEFARVVNEINPGTFNNIDLVPDTDWQDLIFQTAPIHNYQVSASGASPKIQYYIGLGYFLQEGIIPKSNHERLTLKINNTYHLNDFVRLGNNLSFTPFRQQNTHGNAPFVVYRAQPTVAPFQPDGSYSVVPGVGNVLADIEYTNNFNKGLRTVSNFFGEVDFLQGFTFRTSFGIDGEFLKNESFTPAFFVSPQQQNAISDLSKGYADRLSWLWENTLTYAKDFGEHRINAVAGYTMQESSSENLSAIGENIIREERDFWYLNPDNINPGTVSNTVDIDNNYSIISYLFRVNYSFRETYLFTATYRVDGSSKFARQNRYGDFPSFALGWNIINEDFMRDVDIFSDLKLRASWGIIGNEKIRYDRQFSPVLFGVGAVLGRNETIYPGSTYGVTGNPDLRWESTQQTDVGVELGFFDNRLTAEFDYYHKTTKDILIDLPVPGYLGNGVGAAITYNVAEVLNRGFEYNIAWKSEWNDLRYRIGTIGTTIHNEALRVFGTGGEGDRLFNAAQTTATSPGLPLGAFFGYQVDGVFQNQQELNSYPHLPGAGVGDLRYVDTNNDGVLNSEDRTFIGSPIPKFLYGINLELFYKAFDLSIDFQGQSGNKIYNAKETVRPDLYNFEQHVFDRWRGEGTSTTEPRATAGGYNWLPSTRFIQDGSFFRLRSITLGYNLPGDLSQKLRMKSARVYLRGTNVFTLTDFTGYSPEVAGGPLDFGIDNSTYPVTAIYSAGVNVTF